MPFWAIYMIACGALVLLGWRVDEWKVPALIFLGLVGVRLTPFTPDLVEYLLKVTLTEDGRKTIHALGSCTVWVAITALVAYNSGYITAFLLGISTIVYLPLLVVGYRIERMGLLPVVSDLFLILAILVCGGGIFGKHIDRYRDSRRPSLELGDFESIVAKVENGATEAIGKGG